MKYLISKLFLSAGSLLATGFAVSAQSVLITNGPAASSPYNVPAGSQQMYWRALVD